MRSSRFNAALRAGPETSGPTNAAEERYAAPILDRGEDDRSLSCPAVHPYIIGHERGSREGMLWRPVSSKTETARHATHSLNVAELDD
jgi:hypothetical protein